MGRSLSLVQIDRSAKRWLSLHRVCRQITILVNGFASWSVMAQCHHWVVSYPWTDANNQRVSCSKCIRDDPLYGGWMTFPTCLIPNNHFSAAWRINKSRCTSLVHYQYLQPGIYDGVLSNTFVLALLYIRLFDFNTLLLSRYLHMLHQIVVRPHVRSTAILFTRFTILYYLHRCNNLKSN